MGVNTKVIFAHLVAAAFVGAIAVVASRHRRGRKRYKEEQPVEDQTIIPQLHRTESGRVGDFERFSHYVARQLGFEDANECANLCKVAQDYLRKSEGCEMGIFEYFAREPESEALYVKLTEELERCILAYFAFHWNHASSMIAQVLNDESEKKKTKLKDLVMAATRQQRFERVVKNLKVARLFSTLVNEMRAIGADSQRRDVMVPAALSQRSPVLLLMGGGMGAGKSTVLRDVLKEPFWAGAAANAVVVEADAFKETDVIYRALSSRGRHDDMLQTAELVPDQSQFTRLWHSIYKRTEVHQSSTDAASSLLVTALNEGRDVIMDGTLSWEPFVEQTVAMARNVHKRRYRMGVGYKVADDGTVTENYWEQAEEDNDSNLENGEVSARKPYRIEMVGVVCDAYLAVVRGIRRAIMVGRAVRVNSQLKSHKRFATAFPNYCRLVDNARLYCTNAVGGPPKLIAWKDGDSKILVDTERIKCLTQVSRLDPEAENVYKLYTDPSLIYEQGSVWNDVVLCPSRPVVQSDLKKSIRKIEASTILKQAQM